MVLKFLSQRKSRQPFCFWYGASEPHRQFGKGIGIAHAMVGEYLTVQEMAGFQMFVAKLDDELLALLEAPSNAPYWITP